MLDTSYHSIQSTCSAESKPQSIVHQIIRLEKHVEKKAKKMFASRKKNGTKKNKKSVGTASSTKDSLSTSISGTKSLNLESEDDHSLSSSFAWEESVACSSIQGSLDASQLDFDEECDFETIDQNTFITQVLMDTLSETNYVIHFFSDDCLEYFDYEDQLTQVLVNSASKEFELYRMSSQMAPLFTSKLGINPELSTLIHVYKGKVLSRLDDLANQKSMEEVKEWLREAGESQDFAGARHPLS
ncbi:unnamed protein product [Cylindrotheca closterium]|uniref:Uncharacterized protein n=1 Tax=Cylindrotheca closterium TaxID=2856 RepID=A0AAD2JPN5_9STRA|nr:unnamed protein product [Cylindrotheca closterium]